jgi:hypothetical protein
MEKSAKLVLCSLRDATDALTTESGAPAWDCDFMVNGRPVPAGVALESEFVDLMQDKSQDRLPMFLFTLEGRRLGLASFEGSTTLQFFEQADPDIHWAVESTVRALENLRQYS